MPCQQRSGQGERFGSAEYHVFTMRYFPNPPQRSRNRLHIHVCACVVYVLLLFRSRLHIHVRVCEIV